MFDKGFYGFEPEKFAEMFKVGDFAKAFENIQAPQFDAEAVAAAYRKNVEAMVDANKIAVAGAQDIMTKQVEMFEAAATGAQKQIADVKMDAFTPEVAQKQGEAMKVAFEKNVAEVTEIAEMARKTGQDAFDVVKARAEAAMEELKTVATPAAA